MKEESLNPWQRSKILEGQIARKRRVNFNPSHEDIEKAIREYLQSGKEIKKLPPQKCKSPNLYISMESPWPAFIDEPLLI